jgi:hypothetical protein
MIACEADEESNAYRDKGSLRQIKLHFPITDYFPNGDLLIRQSRRSQATAYSLARA